MKKILAALLSLTMITATACGSSLDSGSKPAQTAKQVGTPKAAGTSQAEQTETQAEQSTQTEAAEQTTQAPQESTSGGVLVAYFTPAENGENDAISSASKVSFWGEDMGNAEAIANVIAAYTDGDLFSIQTVKDYPLDYNELLDAAKAEQAAGELPELATAVDISGYNTVFVVYPVWWYTMPQAIYSFIDEYDLSGKTVIPVTTHGGSGLADSIERFKELEPNADVKDGYDVNGDDVGGSQSDIEGWLSDNGF